MSEGRSRKTTIAMDIDETLAESINHIIGIAGISLSDFSSRCMMWGVEVYKAMLDSNQPINADSMLEFVGTLQLFILDSGRAELRKALANKGGTKWLKQAQPKVLGQKPGTF